MREVAHALQEAGLPSDLADASAAIMSRWGSVKDSSLDIPQALDHLHDAPDGKPS